MDQVDPVSCAELIRSLPSFLDSEVEATESAALSAHLERCAHCLTIYRFERAVLDNLQAKLRTASVPPDLERRVLELIGSQTGHRNDGQAFSSE